MLGFSPTFAGMFTSIPFVVRSSNVFPKSALFTLILPSSNVVPSGILSFTFTVDGAVPLFDRFIVYVILSPAFTLLPLAGSDVLLYVTSDLFTVSVTSFVSSPSTTAVFLICFTNSPSGNSSTVTWKLMLAVPAPASVLPGTFTCIPLSKFVCVNSVLSCSFTFILPGTNVVPSGIWSLIVMFLSKSPVLLAVIVYVITSPSTT